MEAPQGQKTAFKPICAKEEKWTTQCPRHGYTFLTLWVNPPTSPCPAPPANAKPISIKHCRKWHHEAEWLVLQIGNVRYKRDNIKRGSTGSLLTCTLISFTTFNANTCIAGATLYLPLTSEILLLLRSKNSREKDFWIPVYMTHQSATLLHVQRWYNHRYIQQQSCTCGNLTSVWFK